jgi:putative FmdB family regulatory protein
MPIYEFICLSCGNEFEKLQSFSDNSTPICTVCQSTQVRRQISPPAIHFKGSGWYVTDSKNGNSKGKNVGKEAPSTDGEKSSESATPTKSSEGASGSETAKSGDAAKATTTAPSTTKDSA